MTDENRPPAASRRNFIKAAGAGTAAAAFGAVTLSAKAADQLKFDAEYDIVVCGGGGGGLPCALFSRWLGNRVAILEKAGSVGGTAAKAAFWYWVPNNEPMRRAGIADPKADYLRYVARLSRPEQYDPSLPKLGLSDWEYEMCEAIYDSASPAAELLASKGALPYRHEASVPDYWAELPEDKAPRGRVLFPKDGLPSMSDGGRVAIRTMSADGSRDGIDIRTGYRVQRVLVDGKGAVVGVEAQTDEGTLFRARVKKAVVFATGGFTHDPELRKNFLHGAVYGGCAAPTNEGDFVRISSALDVQLRNMNYSWMAPISLDKAIAKDGSLSGIFTPTGDSMLYVNKYGKRVVNEKLAYNEVCATFSQWANQQEGGPKKRNDVPAEHEGSVLRGADRRGQSRYKGRPKDQFAWTGARRARHAYQGPVWRRQLCGISVGAGLLGGRRHARADHRLRLSGSQRGPRGNRCAALTGVKP